MSNDLISREKVTQDISKIFADVLISSFRSETVSFDEVNRRVQECLKNQPAAYDVDEVVKRLMCESINCHIMTDRAIEIAKSGSIECSNYLKNENRQQEPANH